MNANPYAAPFPPYSQPSKPWWSGTRYRQIWSLSNQKGLGRRFPHLSYPENLFHWTHFSCKLILKRSPSSPHKSTISTGDCGLTLILLAYFSLIMVLKCNKSLISRNGPKHKMRKGSTQSACSEGHIHQRKSQVIYYLYWNLISANFRTLLK